MKRYGGSGNIREGSMGWTLLWRRGGAVFVVLSVLFLSGCAIKNEGSIDYKKQMVSKKNDHVLLKRYRFDANSPNDSFEEGVDRVSIHLVQGFIQDFPDIINIAKRETKKTKSGEIAVVVKAYELKSDSLLSFDANAIDSGRLVYYGDNVQPGQFLNFSYLPVYGPVVWDGYPIVLQIYIMEIDAQDQQLKPLLHTLAGLGSMLYAPAAPVLTVLDKLGTALLNGNHNDIIFQYNMTLYPDSGIKELGYPVLEPANYVLIRKEDRQEDFNWGDVYLDRDEGRLRTGTGKDGAYFRGESYLVFQVQKNFMFELDSKKAMVYKHFVEKLRSSATDYGKDIQVALEESASIITNEEAYRRLIILANKVKSCVSTYDRYIRDHVSKFVFRLREAISKKDQRIAGAKKYGCLNQNQINSLIAVLQEITPSSEITEKMIVNNTLDVINRVVAAKLQ
jgi:hypothetical protein